MNLTKIEWTDMTWNPVTGCSPVSEGCAHCYAEKISKRFYGGFKVAFHPGRLDEPYGIKKSAKIFVCSMGDLFHPGVPDNFILKVWDTMNKADRHTYMILTKRPERMREFIKYHVIVVRPNIWLGVTAENQKRADERIPILLNTPASIRFVSCEPLLSNMDLRNWNLDWVIAGKETGIGVRPMDSDWVRCLRDDCVKAEIPFFFKNNGGKLDGKVWRQWPK